MKKTLYTLILFYDGSEHRTYTTTDKEKARKIYWKYNVTYGYPPRVWVGCRKLRIHEADELFKMETYGHAHKKLFTNGALARA